MITATSPPAARLLIVAAVTASPGAPCTIEPVTLALPEAGEILVRLEATGICHTDLAAMSGRFPLPLPYVLGHEGIGIVVDRGAGVIAPAIGDRVVLTFESCGGCRRCTAGQPANCAQFDQRNYGRTRADGRPYIRTSDGMTVGGRFSASPRSPRMS